MVPTSPLSEMLLMLPMLPVVAMETFFKSGGPNPPLPFPFPADQEVTEKQAAMVRQVIGNLGSQHTVVGCRREVCTTLTDRAPLAWNNSFTARNCCMGTYGNFEQYTSLPAAKDTPKRNGKCCGIRQSQCNCKTLDKGQKTC